MAEGLPTILVENREAVGALAAAISLFLYRKLRGDWPLLMGLRRKLLPMLHYVVLEPAGGYAAREQREEEFVGTYDLTLKELHTILRSADKIYPNNFASIKFLETQDGRKYESSSWAYRPDGIAGKYQTHLMIYENGDGTLDVYAHYELNPIPNPVKHYEGSPGVWSVEGGVERAIDVLNENDVPEVEVQLRL